MPLSTVQLLFQSGIVYTKQCVAIMYIYLVQCKNTCVFLYALASFWISSVTHFLQVIQCDYYWLLIYSLASAPASFIAFQAMTQLLLPKQLIAHYSIHAG